MVHDVDMARPLNLVLTGYMARIAELVLTLMVARTTSFGPRDRNGLTVQPS